GEAEQRALEDRVRGQDGDEEAQCQGEASAGKGVSHGRACLSHPVWDRQPVVHHYSTAPGLPGAVASDRPAAGFLAQGTAASVGTRRTILAPTAASLPARSSYPRSRCSRPSITVSPSAASPATTKAAAARRSLASTRAPESRHGPRTTATRPSTVMSAPMRRSSSTCLKRLE